MSYFSVLKVYFTMHDAYKYFKIESSSFNRSWLSYLPYGS